MTSALLLAVVFVPMAIEAWRAACNERAQRASGGIEPPGDVYPIGRRLPIRALFAMIAEGALRGGAPVFVLAIGAVAFAFAKR